MSKSLSRQRNAWAFRLHVRLVYEPDLRRWWKLRLSVEPSLWRSDACR